MNVEPLKRTQKNQILLLIEKGGLDPSEFEWTFQLRRGIEDPTLLHTTSNYFFSFHLTMGLQEFSYSPGESTHIYHDGTGNWDGILIAVSRWIQLLKIELDAPDLWSLLSSQKSFLNQAAESNSDVRFSPDERTRIHESIRELKEYIVKVHQLNSEHARQVDDKLEYLVQASERVTKKDFMLIGWSILIQIAVTIGLDGTQAKAFLDMAAASLWWVSEHLPKIVR